MSHHGPIDTPTMVEVDGKLMYTPEFLALEQEDENNDIEISSEARPD